MALSKDGDDPKSPDYTSTGTTGAVDTGGATERRLTADVEGVEGREIKRDNEHGDGEKRGDDAGAGGSKTTKWSDKWDIKENDT